MSSGAVKGQVKGQMKGLLKGLRYISQIFDEEDEKEIQIGFPTDVKHLAHIGAENAKASQPSWLTEFKESAEKKELSDASSGTVVNPAKATSEDDANSKGEGRRSRKSRPRSTESQSSMTRDISSGEGSKPSRRHHSESSRRMNRHLSEEEKEKPPTSKHTHRRKSKTTSSEEKDEKEGSSRRAPRSRRQSKGDSLTDFSFSDSRPCGPN